MVGTRGFTPDFLSFALRAMIQSNHVLIGSSNQWNRSCE